MDNDLTIIKVSKHIMAGKQKFETVKPELRKQMQKREGRAVARGARQATAREGEDRSAVIG